MNYVNSELESENLALTKELFVCLGNKDIEGILSRLDPEVHIEFYGSKEIPYAGDYTGLVQSRKFFETVYSSIVIDVFNPQEFICKDDKVVVFGNLELTTQNTKNRIISNFAHIITCKNGKWISFRDFMNTVVAYKAFENYV